MSEDIKQRAKFTLDKGHTQRGDTYCDIIRDLLKALQAAEKESDTFERLNDESLALLHTSNQRIAALTAKLQAAEEVNVFCFCFTFRFCLEALVSWALF